MHFRKEKRQQAWLREAQQSCASLYKKWSLTTFYIKHGCCLFFFKKKKEEAQQSLYKKRSLTFFCKASLYKKWSLTTFYIKHGCASRNNLARSATMVYVKFGQRPNFTKRGLHFFLKKKRQQQS